MKINRYECDLCGMPMVNGREHKLTIKFPVPEDEIMIDHYARSRRKMITVELCDGCFEERLKEFAKGDKA